MSREHWNSEDLARLELLLEIITELKELGDNGATIVVEGKRDRKALEELGVRGQIVLVSQRPLLEVVESLPQDGEVVLLTDWDKRGDEIAKKIAFHLQYRGIAANTRLRGKIRNLVKKKIKDVEGLPSHLYNLAGQNIACYFNL